MSFILERLRTSHMTLAPDSYFGFSNPPSSGNSEPENEVSMIQGEKTGVPMSDVDINESGVTRDVQAVYDQIAQTFEETRSEHQGWFLERAQFLLQKADEEYGGLGDRILEVGAGTGSMIDYLLQKGVGREIVGLDISSKMLAIAKSRHVLPSRNGATVNYVLGNATKVGAIFPHNYFDSVFSMFADIHVFAFREALKARFEVLKPGGRALIMVPTNHRFLEYMENAERRNGSHPDSWWERKKSLLDKQGFLWLREVFPEMSQVLGTQVVGVPTLFMMEEQWINELYRAGFGNIGVYKPDISSGYPRYMVIAGVAEKEVTE